ncbi:MAG: thioredoxin domain-containing protein [Planctomycetes bacterium]|nr:thioredoxin domain-containing protein [Planctomycetota bacterium]
MPHRNRLASESSPYLRQHAHNPVDWYPWGPEALQRAKAEDKPIFLSIGYSACHWCHVMEDESFANPEIAALMNAQFINIKVDREERPDLDDLYIAAVQAMGVAPGWPLSVWLAPDGKPFFGGTYFPPEDGMGRPGFKRVLTGLAEAWQQRRSEVLAGGDELAAHLQQALAPKLPPGEPGPDLVTTLPELSLRHYDDTFAGFAEPPHFAPKFPRAAEIAVLLRQAASARHGRALVMATATLDQMVQGGMFDQLAGGFHRYSTDRQWLVPHFEKMLYDNALLVPAYLDAYRLTGAETHAVAARRTLDWMSNAMQDPRGGFWSSMDADSEGVEGRFFVWSKAEFDAVTGADAAIAARHFGVTPEGNWEHTNVLAVAVPAATIAQERQVDESAIGEAIERARAALLAARAQRVAPATDDKILTAWNGMAIAACARGYRVLGEHRYLRAAQSAAAFALRELVVDGRCRRSWHSGQARHQGYLEDHALLADALLTLFEADADPRWLLAARTLLQTIATHFTDADGSLWFTANDHEALVARAKSVTETSTPSGAAVATMAFLRAGLLLGDQTLYDRGVAALRAYQQVLAQYPLSACSLVLALQFHLADPREVVIAGEPDDPRTQALLQRAAAAFPDHHVTALVHAGNRAALQAISPVFVGKEPVNGVPAAFVCRRGVCERPITDPARLLP